VDYDGVDVDGNGNPVDLLDESPPYIPYQFYPPVFPAGPSSTTMTGPFADYWLPNSAYAAGQVVFPQRIDVPPLGEFSYDEVDEPRFRLGFRCITAGTSGATSNDEPAWPTKPGLRVSDGTTGLVWESFDNRRPLQAIRLTVRYHDKTSDNMRQLSLVMPLTTELK
jgi:hypothetical protein